MPQARLIDINTAAIMYRREVLTSLKYRNYDNCFGALYALNGLLPKDYRVKISSLEYDKLTRQDVFAKCSYCDKEIDFKSVQVCTVLKPFDERMVSDHSHHKIWMCTECKKENRLDRTQMYQKTLQEPYFLRVVPKPPLRKDGVTDRSTYHRKVVQWVWTLLDELEERFAAFRDDNWQKKDDLYDDGFELDSSEEEDANP